MIEEYIKIHSSISTRTFLESGLRMNIGEAVKEILIEAKKTNRLISGLSDASKYLRETENLENSLFFFIVPSSNGNSLTHIQEVVLQSFCFENDIYIVKLDSIDKLNKIIGFEQGTETCALVQRLSQTDRSQPKKDKYTDLELVLIDHCEDFWDELVQPIIKLPDNE